MFKLNFRNRINTWPAFVDLFSNLVIILIFLLIVFVFLWTTTSVFNKRTGVQTIAELKHLNAEQTAQINQMNADNEEAMRLLIQARAELESNEMAMNDKNLSIVDLITAYENEVAKIKESDYAARQEVESLRDQLKQTIAAKEQLAELEQQRRELQEKMQEQMAAQREQLDAQSEQLNAKTEQLDAQNKQMTAQKEEMNAKMKTQESQMAEYEAELKRLNAALADADKAAQAEQAKYIEMSNKLNKALADKVAELQDMREYQSEFYRAIKIALGDTHAVEAEGDRFIVPSDILFTTGSYKLSTEGKKQLKQISSVINEMESKIPSNIDWIIRVDGHTDNRPVARGNRKYANNMQLSLLRATAVVNELIKDGVQNKRLVPSGFGDMYPVAPNTDKVNMGKNRRIELQLTNK